MCYDHVGHGFFLEDGNEEGNLLQGNLGLGTKAGSGKLVHSDAIKAPTGERGRRHTVCTAEVAADALSDPRVCVSGRLCVSLCDPGTSCRWCLASSATHAVLWACD